MITYIVAGSIGLFGVDGTIAIAAALAFLLCASIGGLVVWLKHRR